jgi:hypothetical protein
MSFVINAITNTPAALAPTNLQKAFVTKPCLVHRLTAALQGNYIKSFTKIRRELVASGEKQVRIALRTPLEELTTGFSRPANKGAA